jgi:DNA-binding MarR family transcriptional regulator
MANSGRGGGRDAVDAIVAQWGAQRPDLDTSAKQIAGRILRLEGLFQQAYREAFAALDINETDYGVLAPLRRAGPPYELTPTALARFRMMTSGGMTAAIDRMERKGFVVRRPNPDDRRGSFVCLTDEGRKVIDAAMARHIEVEHELVECLTDRERTQLQSLLRKLLISVEGEFPI